MYTDNSPFQPIVSAWLALFETAQRFKDRRFGPQAVEGMRFYAGPYDFWFRDAAPDKFFHVPNDSPAEDTIVVTVNKVAEMVQLYGPVLYHKNPVRRVTPTLPAVVDPAVLGAAGNPQLAQMYGQALQQAALSKAQADARASLLEQYLNVTPDALNLKTHATLAIDEGLIKGEAPLFTETFTVPGGTHKMVGSFWDSVDNVLKDPDGRGDDSCRWMSRRCCHPAWYVEQKFRLPPGTLKPCMESASQQAAITATGRGPILRSSEQASDLVEYYEVYSKMGVGGRLKTVADAFPQTRMVCELFGDFAYLVIVPGLPYPINCPPWVYDGTARTDVAAGRAALQWPIPFWADGGWPMTMIRFHTIPNDPWGLSHLSPGMGELKFLNWAFTKIVNKIKVTSRELLCVPDDADKQFEDWLYSGKDQEIVRYAKQAGMTAKDFIQFVQMPTWNPEIWRVIEAVSEAFDKRVGLTELVYGMSGASLRSAAEANVKSSATNVRPDDMANKVEDAMSLVARKEMLAAQWSLTPLDVAPVLHPLGAAAWQQLVFAANPKDIIYNLRARVESGTARRPNQQQLIDNMQAALNQLFPPLMQYAMTTGNTNPVNALIADWGKSIGLTTIDRYLIPTPPPMPPQPPGPPRKAA